MEQRIIPQNKKKTFFQAVVALVVPMALQNLINVGIQSADVIMLGKVDEIALSSASLAGQIQFVLMLIFFGQETLPSRAAVTALKVPGFTLIMIIPESPRQALFLLEQATPEQICLMAQLVIHGRSEVVMTRLTIMEYASQKHGTPF